MLAAAAAIEPEPSAAAAVIEPEPTAAAATIEPESTAAAGMDSVIEITCQSIHFIL